MANRIALGFVLLAAVTTASPAAARVIEIFPSNADATCNEEFESVANSLQPGDELVLHGGIYTQGCRRLISGIHGTTAQPIVIRAADGETPVLTRPGNVDFDFNQNNIEIENVSYVIIQGLTFRGGDAGVRFMGTGHHVTFEDNEVADTGSVGVTLNSGNFDAMLVRFNHIHHTGRYTLGATEGEGMYVGCNNDTCRTTNSLIENNYIHHLRSTSGGGNDGIEIKPGSAGNVIRDNVIHDTTIGTRFPCIFVYGGGGAVNVVEGNTLWNCGEAIQVAADALIRNNLILYSDVGITAAPHSQVPQPRNVSIVNNTIYGHDACLYVRWSGATGMALANNALYCPGGTAVDASGLSAASVVSNFVEGGLSGATRDGVRFVSGGAATTAFVNPAGFDFWPGPVSPLRGAADASLVPPGDFNGTQRAPPADVGAYETNDLVANPGWRVTTGFKVTGAAPPPNPNGPSGLGQFKADGVTALPVGATTDQTSVVVKLTVSTPNNPDTLTPEVEIKPLAMAFNGSGIVAGTAVTYTGTSRQATATVTGLTPGTQYHWRARVKDAGGRTSAWVSFGNNLETEQDVSVTNPAPPASEIIIDNAAAAVQDTAGGRTFTGTWAVSSAANPFGATSLKSIGTGLDTYRWTPNIPTTRWYQVYVRWTQHAARSASVPYSVVHAGGSSQFTRDQKTGGSQWQLLGTFTFTAGSSGYVQVSDANGEASADAARWVPAAPEIVLDNAAAGVQDAAGGRTFTGTWAVSSAANPFGAASLKSVGTGLDTYRWTPSIPATGVYQVHVRWTQHVARSASVPYTVVHAGGSSQFTRDQKTGGSQWQLLDSFTFTAGTSGYVQVSDANGEASADAARWVPQ